MKKKNITDSIENYISTGEAKELLLDKEKLKLLQKYSAWGTRKTFYRREDVLALNQKDESKECVKSKEELQPCKETETANTFVEKAAPTFLALDAYIGGSFNPKTGVYGSSVIMVNNDEVIAIKTSNGTRMKSMRNIAGEISAVALAVKMAEELYVDGLTICYYYEGIKKWATGDWHAKNEYTSQYAAFMKRPRAFNISFKYIENHADDKYNKMADDMAIRAVGLKPEYDDRSMAPTQKKIPEDILRMKYQVKTSCLEGIKRFYSKEKKAFKDYLGLKIGTGDNFSRYWSMEDFTGIISADTFSYVKEKLSDNNSILNALRWVARGLDPYDAVKKVNVDTEIYSKGSKNY